MGGLLSVLAYIRHIWVNIAHLNDAQNIWSSELRVIHFGIHKEPVTDMAFHSLRYRADRSVLFRQESSITKVRHAKRHLYK